MADGEIRQALTVVAKLDHKQVEQAMERLGEASKKGFEKASKGMKSWTARFNDALSSGKKTWFQDVEIPYGKPRLMKKFADALKLNDEQMNMAGQNPALSKWSADESGTIKTLQAQLKLYNKLTTARNNYNKEKAETAAKEEQRQINAEIKEREAAEKAIQDERERYTQLERNTRAGIIRDQLQEQEAAERERIAAEKQAAKEIEAADKELSKRFANDLKEARASINARVKEEKVAEKAIQDERDKYAKLARAQYISFWENIPQADLDAHMPKQKTGILDRAREMLSAAHATDRMRGAVAKASEVFERFGRVVTWRLYRMAAQKVLQSASQGLQKLVEWDRTYGNNTSNAAKTVDALKAKWGQVEKAAGAAAMPVIQLFQPAITTLMNGLVKVFELIQMIARSLQGYKTYMKATYQEMSNTTGAAKELQRVLFGFDDLNVLPSNKGGGSSSEAGQWDFVETSIDNKLLNGIADITNHFRDLIGENETLNGLLDTTLGSLLLIGGATVLGGLKLLHDSTHNVKDKFAGLAIAAGGALIEINGISDQFKNGINWGNAIESIGGAAGVIAGLGTAFGEKGAGIGAIASGLGLLVTPISELAKYGNLSWSGMTQLATGLTAVAGGVGLLVGGTAGTAIAVAGAAIAGLAAGTKAISDSVRKSNEEREIEIYGDTLKNLTDGIKEHIDAIKERVDEVLKGNETDRAALEAADNLISKYFELAKKEELTADEKERMRDLSQDIVAIYPELNGYLDEENGLLQISKDEWAEIYKKKLADIKLEARRKALVKLYEAQIEIELDLEKQQDALNKSQEHLNQTIKDHPGAQLVDDLSTIMQKMVANKWQTDTLTDAEKKLLEQYTNGTDRVEDLAEAISELTIEYSDDIKEVGKAKDAHRELQEGFANTEAEASELANTIERVADGSYKDISESNAKTKTSVTETGETVKAAVKGASDYAKKNSPRMSIEMDGNSTEKAKTGVSNAIDSAQKTANGNPVRISTTTTPPTNTSSIVTEAQRSVNREPAVSIRTAMQSLSQNPIAAVIAAAQKTASGLSPITLYSSLALRGLPAVLARAWEAMQRRLNGNPLVFAATVGVSASDAMTIANAKNNIAATAFASGGIVPNAGQLIQVNEAGPEVVANLGHSTGIMNVNQMQEAVAAGNIDVINTLFTIANTLTSAINNKDMNVYMDGDKIGRSVTAYQGNQMRRGVAY